MSNNSLLGKLKSKTLPLLTASALAISSVYGCEGGGTTQPTQKPVANFVANPKEGYAPLETCFNGSSSKSNGSQITRYIWQFESGVADSTSGENVCHVYQNPGNYMAGLTVEDGNGQRSSPKLEQIVSRDGNPVINMQNLNGIEDKVSSLDLTGKVTSPIHPLANLTITTTSPHCLQEYLHYIATGIGKELGYGYILRIISRNPNVHIKTLEVIANDQKIEQRYAQCAKTALENGKESANHQI